MVLSVSGSVCDGDKCSKESARMVGGEISQQNSRPFQVSRSTLIRELSVCFLKQESLAVLFYATYRQDMSKPHSKLK